MNLYLNSHMKVPVSMDSSTQFLYLENELPKKKKKSVHGLISGLIKILHFCVSINLSHYDKSMYLLFLSFSTLIAQRDCSCL